MFEGVLSTMGKVLCLLAGAFLMVNSAAAADLGDDCCADLEERIAELEATTARKGNRKVSLTVSGWISNQVMYWDDGYENNVYIVDQLPDLSSRISVSGSAQINAKTKAGYYLTVAFDNTDAFFVDQFNDDAGTGPFLIHSYWFLENSDIGRLSVGFLQHASDNPTFDIDRSGTIFSSNQVLFDGSSMVLRPDGGIGPGYALGADPLVTAARWRSFAHCESVQLGIGLDCAGDRRNAVRYDTPAWHGLVLSASWGEDDFWDAKAVWNTDYKDVQIGLSASYTDSTDFPDGPAELFQAGLYLKHMPTGLWVLAAYNDETSKLPGRPDGSAYYVKGGLAEKWTPLGTTYVFGEVGQMFDQYGAIADGASLCGAFFGVGGAISSACTAANDANVKITGSKFTRLGAVLQQDIDAAAMTIWLKYYNYSLDADFYDGNTATNGKQGFEDLNMVTLGAAIFY